MIITIDGPAGSGKSTAARKLAAHLEIPYLDTGAMYRAIAYAALQRKVDLNDEDALLDLARSVRLELDCGPTHTRIRLDGHDVSEAIRTLSVAAATSYVARNQGIRDHLVARQQDMGRQLGSFVAEGRDQGSVVFPDATVKFVLVASLEKRAQRRHQEVLSDGEDVRIEEIVRNLGDRDAVDTKQWESLLQSGSAVVLDTTDLTIAEVVERLYEAVAGKGA